MDVEERHDETTAASEDTRPPTRRTAAAALAVAAAVTIVFIVIDPAAAPFVAPITVIALVGAGLAARFGVWAQALAALLGIGGLGNLVSPNGVIALTTPQSFWDFAPMAVFGIACLVAVIAGLAGAVPRWRGADLGMVRVVGVVLAGVVVVVSLVAVVVTDAQTVDPGLAAGATVITVSEAGFASDAAAAAASGDVLVVNDGRIAHTFTSEALDIDVVLAPGDEVLVALPAETGTIAYWCVPHSAPTDDGGREGMVGTLDLG